MNPDLILQNETFRPIIIYGIPIFGLIILLIANYIQCWNMVHPKEEPSPLKDPILGWYLTAVLTGIIINIGMAYSLHDQIVRSYKIQDVAFQELKSARLLQDETNKLYVRYAYDLKVVAKYLELAWPQYKFSADMEKRMNELKKNIDEINLKIH